MGVLFTLIMVMSVFASARTFTHLLLRSLLEFFSLSSFPLLLFYFHGMRPTTAVITPRPGGSGE